MTQERHRSALDEFLYELRSEFADPNAITRFDQLDFVLVDGDGSSSPWAPSARKLALLVKMCMMTGKCLFAAGLGAALLSYVCVTGGELLRVLNNSGEGSLLDTVHDLPPPPSSDSGDGVLLDTKTGDYFAFSARDNCWVPKGNTGLVLHSSDDARLFYGARPNSARAGGVNKTGSGQSSLCLARRGEERCCARLEAMKGHAVLRAALASDGNNLATSSSRELVLRCTSRWDVDEEISSTGANRFRVLMDSARGPMLLEFSNCMGAHFELDARAYPATLELLRQFVRAKYEELKVYAHLDRSYVAAISGGNARLRERLVLAQNKRVARPLSAGASSTASRTVKAPAVSMTSDNLTGGGSASTGAGMSPGRTSPKRCRPVSAGPQRSTNKANVPPPRTIQTSRSVYPSVSASTSTPVMALSRIAENNGPATRLEDPSAGNAADLRDRSTREGWKDSDARPETDETLNDLATGRSNSSSGGNCEDETPKPKPRIVRVPQKNELEKPYCAFSKRREEEQQQQAQHRHTSGDEYYSIVNDAPYMSAYEREMLEQQVSELVDFIVLGRRTDCFNIAAFRLSMMPTACSGASSSGWLVRSARWWARRRRRSRPRSACSLAGRSCRRTCRTTSSSAARSRKKRPSRWRRHEPSRISSRRPRANRSAPRPTTESDSRVALHAMTKIYPSPIRNTLPRLSSHVNRHSIRIAANFPD